MKHKNILRYKYFNSVTRNIKISVSFLFCIYLASLYLAFPLHHCTCQTFGQQPADRVTLLLCLHAHRLVWTSGMRSKNVTFQCYDLKHLALELTTCNLSSYSASKLGGATELLLKFYEPFSPQAWSTTKTHCQMDRTDLKMAFRTLCFTTQHQ